MGLAFCLLYMARYNLTVAKVSLGDLMSHAEFANILTWGSLVYAFALFCNGPIVDRIGGRRGFLIALGGACLSNLAMGIFLIRAMGADGECIGVFQVMLGLFCLNMYFQSFGTLSLIKVCAPWFHIRERGAFAGIFATLLGAGLFLAFTGNFLLLDIAEAQWGGGTHQWIVFFVPALLLGLMAGVEFIFLRERPSEAGFEDFDTGDMDGGEEGQPISTNLLLARTFRNPILLTIGAIEFCTGALRGSLLNWFPVYATEAWSLPSTHLLRQGSWSSYSLALMGGVVALVLFLMSREVLGKTRLFLLLAASACALGPLLQGGWGGILLCAGIAGGVLAGWASDRLHKSRRAPAVAVYFTVLLVGAVSLALLSRSAPTRVVDWAGQGSGLRAGDEIVAIGDVNPVHDWADVTRGVSCVPQSCDPFGACQVTVWDSQECQCSEQISYKQSILGLSEAGYATRIATTIGAEAFSRPAIESKLEATPSDEMARVYFEVESSLQIHGIPATVVRNGKERTLRLSGTSGLTTEKGGRLAARPAPGNTVLLGGIVFLMAMSFLGIHGLLTGAASMDFGGTRGAATAVAFIDAMVCLGVAVQSFIVGRLSDIDWLYWPLSMAPFALIGLLLSLRLWNVIPDRKLP